MRDDTREIMDLILGCGRFAHVLLDRYVYVANDINHLTAVCAPSVRGVLGETRVDYDLLLVVVRNLTDPLQGLKDCLAAGRFVGLPKTVKPDHSLDMLARDGRLSDWLAVEMVSDLRRYTLDSRNARNLIASDDKFIGKLKQAFGTKFGDRLESPLADLS